MIIADMSASGRTWRSCGRQLRQRCKHMALRFCPSGRNTAHRIVSTSNVCITFGLYSFGGGVTRKLKDNLPFWCPPIWRQAHILRLYPASRGSEGHFLCWFSSGSSPRRFKVQKETLTLDDNSISTVAKSQVSMRP